MNEPLDLSNPNNNNDPQKSRVTKLQEKLYSPNTQFQIRSRQNLKRDVKDVPNSWDEKENASFSRTVGKEKMSIFMKLVIFAFIFFIGAASFAFYKFAGEAPATYSNTVEVSVVGPVTTGGGEPTSLDVIIQNRNPFAIQTVDIVLEYPEGTKSVDLTTDLPRLREGLGDIPANSIVKKTYVAALFGEEGDQKDIEVRAEYRVPNSNAIFESKKIFALVLQSSPVRLVVDTVTEITSGQALSFNVTVASNSNSDLEDVLVTVDYPFGFNFSQSTLTPTKGNNVWYFDKLAPQESKTFTVRGSLIGQNNEERVFKWNIGLAQDTNDEEFKVKFTTVPKSISLSRPFLAMDVSIDGDFGVDLIREGGKQIGGRVTYTNNTGSVVTDPEIILKLDGEVLDDPSVVASGGFFNSSDNTITWNKVTNPQLFTSIAVNQSETLVFNFRTKPLATRQAVYKNPEIIVNTSITGKRISENNVPENIKVDSAKRIKLKSDVVLSAVTSHAGGPFQNSGPIPPKVETDTSYTVTLSVTNSSNLIQNGRVRAVLPPNVRWNNIVAPGTERVTYIPSSRTIEWDLGDVREHVGFIDDDRSVSMQLTISPSSNQVGQTPSLLDLLTFSGFDDFAQIKIDQTAQSPTTDMGRLSGLDDAKVVQ